MFVRFDEANASEEQFAGSKLGNEHQETPSWRSFSPLPTRKRAGIDSERFGKMLLGQS